MLFRMYASCSVDDSSEGFEEWMKNQEAAYQLFEEVSQKLPLGMSHRKWFHSKLAMGLPVPPEALVALALSCEGMGGLQNLALYGEALEEAEISEEADSGSVVPMFYGFIRTSVEMSGKEKVESLAGKYSSEQDFELLQSLAIKKWPSVEREQFHCEYAFALAKSLSQTQQMRTRLSSGLQASFVSEGKVLMKYSPLTAPSITQNPIRGIQEGRRVSSLALAP